MERYLYTARRYRWMIAIVLAIVAISGSSSAYAEYVTTYESSATIWIVRSSQNLLQTMSTAPSDQPDLPSFQTPANEYADILNQFVQTQAFLRDVIERSSLKDELAGASDQLAYIDAIRKRFKVQALGINLVRVSYRASSADVAFEMVSGALVVRDERTLRDLLGATNTATAIYQRELDLAQTEAIRAQRQLDEFNNGHQGSLTASDDYKQRQLRLGADLSELRLQDLQSRLDRATLPTALFQLAQGANVVVIDKPEAPRLPSGGLRQGAFLLGVALAGGIALAGLMVVLGTLLQANIASEADLGRLGTAPLFATIPQIARGRSRGPRRELRGALAATAFGSGQTTRSAEAGT